ncbi:MAG: hypothetical protein N2448_06060 [Caloramator sp.]|nr:hypothetical protein [Caloramator sp.]
MKKINMIFIALLLILHSTLVYAYKPYNTKNSEVINTAPVGNINANSYKKTVDLVVMTDYTKDKLSNLQSALNNFKSDMFSKNINVNIKILNRKTKLDNFKKINTKGYTVDVYQTGFGPGWSDYIYNIAKIVNGKVYFRISRYYNDNWNPIQYKSFNVVNEINNAIQVKFLSMNTIEVLDKYGNVYKVTYTDNEDTTKYTIQQYDKSILQPDEKIIKISIYNGLSMCLTDEGHLLY